MEFDFSTNGTVDSLDKVPEQFRPVYTAGQDGKFTINPTMKGIADAITGLNGALKNERKTTTTLKGQKDVASVVKETFGVDTVEEVKAKIDELTQQVAEKSKVDPAKIKADIEKAFGVKEEGYKADKAKMQATLDKYLVDSAGLAALAEAKGNAKLLMPIIKSQAVVVPDGEEYVVRIKDPSGDYRGNGAGGFMTVADLVKELKASADYGVAFASDAPAGGGKPTGQSTQQSRQTSQRQTQQDNGEKSAAQRIADGLKARRGR
ncbi:minor capsid protein [Rhodobacter phage RcRudolph]|nr:minor capsid protein [Rhodobacter phage RcRudolph]